MSLLAAAASAAIVNARRYLRAQRQADHMTAALASREHIGQATGVVRAQAIPTGLTD